MAEKPLLSTAGYHLDIVFFGLLELRYQDDRDNIPGCVFEAIWHTLLTCPWGVDLIATTQTIIGLTTIYSGQKIGVSTLAVLLQRNATELLAHTAVIT